jgi:hypothetical protein
VRPFVVPRLRGLYPLAARKGRLKAELQTKPADSLIVQSLLRGRVSAELRTTVPANRSTYCSKYPYENIAMRSASDMPRSGASG